MPYKSPSQRLNEILLQAAIRAENRNADKHADDLAKQVARLNDELAGEE